MRPRSCHLNGPFLRVCSARVPCEVSRRSSKAAASEEAKRTLFGTLGLLAHRERRWLRMYDPTKPPVMLQTNHP